MLLFNILYYIYNQDLLDSFFKLITGKIKSFKLIIIAM